MIGGLWIMASSFAAVCNRTGIPEQYSTCSGTHPSSFVLFTASSGKFLFNKNVLSCFLWKEKSCKATFAPVFRPIMAQREVKKASLTGKKYRRKNRNGWKTPYNDASVIFQRCLWLSRLLQKWASSNFNAIQMAVFSVSANGRLSDLSCLENRPFLDTYQATSKHNQSNWL